MNAAREREVAGEREIPQWIDPGKICIRVDGSDDDVRRCAALLSGQRVFLRGVGATAPRARRGSLRAHEGCTTARSWPLSTLSPTATRISATMPPPRLASSFCIFIASSTTTGAPGETT